MDIYCYSKSQQKIILNDSNEINRGGEGRILLMPSGKQVAKLYFDSTKALSEQKLGELAVLDKQLFVCPKEVLYADSSFKEPMGYVMDYLDASWFPLSALFNKAFCNREGVDFNKKKLLAIKILEAVSQAHSHDIILGDLHGLNILINKNGSLKFIDTDAFGTATYPHSGMLMDEIRDYYHIGRVSKNSDYFAAAVVIFYMLTYAHPFKGIHAVYKSLRERMVMLLPLWVNDGKLTPPKCYEPIAAGILMDQFQRIFEQGERFLLQLDAQGVVQAARPHLVNAQSTAVIQRDGLRIQTVLAMGEGEQLVDIYASEQLLYVRTTLYHYVFSCKEAGQLRQKMKFTASEFDRIWIGNNEVYGWKGVDAWHLMEGGQRTLLRNISGLSERPYVQMDNYLCVLGQDKLLKIKLDEVRKDFLSCDQEVVFAEGFHWGKGCIQMAGGKKYLWFKSGEGMSTTGIPEDVQDVKMQGDIGIAQRKLTQGNDKTISYQYFKRMGLKIIWGAVLTQEVQFAEKGGSIVFEPSDGSLLVRRTEDFAIIRTFDCPEMDTQSSLFRTHSGLLSVFGTSVVLLNTL